MAALAMVMPILPGKKEKWLEMINGINQQPAKAEFDAIRENAGLHEQTFLQETPHGDFVILTYEGDDPAAGWAQIMQSMDEDFAAFALDVHGLDASAPPPALPSSEVSTMTTEPTGVYS